MTTFLTLYRFQRSLPFFCWHGGGAHRTYNLPKRVKLRKAPNEHITSAQSPTAEMPNNNMNLYEPVPFFLATNNMLWRQVTMATGKQASIIFVAFIFVFVAGRFRTAIALTFPFSAQFPISFSPSTIKIFFFLIFNYFLKGKCVRCSRCRKLENSSDRGYKDYFGIIAHGSTF